MFDRRGTDVLRRCGASDRDQRLTGGVRDEVEVKEACIAMRHQQVIGYLWTGRDKAMLRGDEQGSRMEFDEICPHVIVHADVYPPTRDGELSTNVTQW